MVCVHVCPCKQQLNKMSKINRSRLKGLKFKVPNTALALFSPLWLCVCVCVCVVLNKTKSFWLTVGILILWKQFLRHLSRSWKTRDERQCSVSLSCGTQKCSSRCTRSSIQNCSQTSLSFFYWQSQKTLGRNTSFFLCLYPPFIT